MPLTSDRGSLRADGASPSPASTPSDVQRETALEAQRASASEWMNVIGHLPRSYEGELHGVVEDAFAAGVEAAMEECRQIAKRYERHADAHETMLRGLDNPDIHLANLWKSRAFYAAEIAADIWERAHPKAEGVDAGPPSDAVASTSNDPAPSDVHWIAYREVGSSNLWAVFSNPGDDEEMLIPYCLREATAKRVASDLNAAWNRRSDPAKAELVEALREAATIFEETAEALGRVGQHGLAVTLLGDAKRARAALAKASVESASTSNCSDCPPVGYPTDITRCLPCPRRTSQSGGK